jgi:prepilin-type N-terminal cleavage/methylation domain-containing protein
MTGRRRSFGDQRGFTIIELLVVVGIVVVILGLTSGLMSDTTFVFSRETATAGIINDLAAAKNVLLDDLSIAGYLKTPATTFVNVTTAGSSDAVDFEGDVDSDLSPNRICYRVSGGALQRQATTAGTACAANGWETLVTNVTAFDLSFTDATRTTVLTPAQVIAGNAKYARVTITMNTGQTLKGPAIVKSIFGEVALRN